MWSKMVKIYTTPTCQHCDMAKDFLKKKNVRSKEIDAASDANALREMYEKTEQLGVPVIDINGFLVIGFDRDMIETF